MKITKEQGIRLVLAANHALNAIQLTNQLKLELKVDKLDLTDLTESDFEDPIYFKQFKELNEKIDAII